MRKTNLFGATFLALTAGAWSLTALAQTAAPAPAAPMATPAPAPEPTTAPPAPAPDASAPAPDAGASAMPMKKPMHHKMHTGMGKGKLAPTKAGDKAVEDLNDASLNAAKTGKPFTAPPTPDAAKKEAHMPMHKSMHHMKKMKKTDDAAAPAPDASAPAPADAPK